MMFLESIMVTTLSLMSVVQSVDSEPVPRTQYSACTYDYDCDAERAQVCWRLYDGCHHGVCMCNPETHVFDSETSSCRTVRLGGETCSDGAVCLPFMRCQNGTCHCQTGILTRDGSHCLREQHKLLGQMCDPSSDICLQMTDGAYTTEGVLCSQRGHCVCQNNFEEDGLSCLKSRQTSCSRVYECEGGFICMDGRCSCPHNYWPVAKNTKCAKENAIVDLPLGAQCDEINESRYCASGLICHRCHNDIHQKCVKYSLSSADKDHLSAASGCDISSHNYFDTISILVLTYLIRKVMGS